MTRATWGGMRLFGLCFNVFVTEGNRSRSPRSGIEAEAIRKAAHLIASHACSACFPVLLRTPELTLPAVT